MYHHIIYMCDFFNLDDFFAVICTGFHEVMVCTRYVPLIKFSYFFIGRFLFFLFFLHWLATRSQQSLLSNNFRRYFCTTFLSENHTLNICFRTISFMEHFVTFFKRNVLFFKLFPILIFNGLFLFVSEYFLF